MRRILSTSRAVPFAALLLAAEADAQARGPRSSWPFGLEVEVAYAGDLFLPVESGISQRAAYADNLDLLAHLYLDPFGLRGAAVRVHVQSSRGASVSGRVGDLQGVSNIEAPDEWRLYEAWLELNAIPGRLSLLAGVLDVNSEFDVTPGAIELINSSFGFGPEYALAASAGPPTFPETRLGARVLTRPLGDSRAYLNLGIGEAVQDSAGALLSGELGYAVPLPAPGGDAGDAVRVRRRIGRGRGFDEDRAKLALGGWTFTRRLPGWDGEDRGRSRGLYVTGQLRFLERGTTAFAAFARAGWASADVNRIASYYGGGLVVNGPLPGRPEDTFALGVAHARNGDPFLTAALADGRPFRRAETVLEATYKLQVLGVLRLEPDLQWVIHPGAEPGLANALLVGLRWSAGVRVP